jgi:hypothetical protein
MPHWPIRAVISFLFSPEVVIPVVLAALGIAFTVALAPTIRNIRLAHWFFAIAAIWACGGVLRWLVEGGIQMKYLISFLACGLIGTLWLASYTWVEGNHREQAQQQDKPVDNKAEENKTDKKGQDQKKPEVKPKPKDEHPQTGDSNIQTGPITQGPGSIAQVGGTNNQATIINESPDLTMSEAQEKQVSESLGQGTLAGIEISLTILQGTDGTREFATKFKRALESSGAIVTTNEVGMLLPPVGVTLHKGISVMSFPQDTLPALNRIGLALMNARIIRIPLYGRPARSPTIHIVINRGMDTEEQPTPP